MLDTWTDLPLDPGRDKASVVSLLNFVEAGYAVNQIPWGNQIGFLHLVHSPISKCTVSDDLDHKAKVRLTAVTNPRGSGQVLVDLWKLALIDFFGPQEQPTMQLIGGIDTWDRRESLQRSQPTRSLSTIRKPYPQDPVTAVFLSQSLTLCAGLCNLPSWNALSEKTFGALSGMFFSDDRHLFSLLLLFLYLVCWILQRRIGNLKISQSKLFMDDNPTVINQMTGMSGSCMEQRS